MTLKASNFPTTRPTLDLNFALTKRLDPRVTFSRASNATYTDVDGLIKSAATNAPRFDHNPSTGESLGLLVEEARTNSIHPSEPNNASPRSAKGSPGNAWGVFDGTVFPGIRNGITGLEVTINSTLNNNGFNGVNATNWGGIAGGGAHAGGTSAVVSFFIHPLTWTGNIWLGRLPADGNNTFAAQNFQLFNNGVYTGPAANVKAVLSDGTYWLHNISWTSLSTNTFLSQFLVIFTTTAGDNSKKFWAGGFQHETETFSTSYIPTPATFTGRASTATFYDSAGIIQTAASGVARSAAFLPDSAGVMRPVGLLLEAAATNLLNGSQTFATTGGTQNNWVDTNITRNGTLRTSPDGTANALRVTASAADATIISSAAIGTSASRTFSIFLRRITGTGNIQYTLDNGTTWTTQAITSSWVRYSFPATTANQQVGIRITTSGDAIELWGAQLETGSAATSYIPTTTATVTRAADTSTSAAVTRAADVAQIGPGTNFSSWYNQNSGTLFVNVNLAGSFNTGLTLFSRSAAIADNSTGILMAPASYRMQTGRMVGASNYGSGNPGQLTPPTNQSVSYKSVESFDLSTNLFAVLIRRTDVAEYAETFDRTNLPTISTRMLIGLTAPPIPVMRLSRITYWSTRLPNATLQALTR